VNRPCVASEGPLGRDVKSPREFAAAVIFLLALPMAALCQMVVGAGAETVVHAVLALGSALLSLAVFDRTARWVAWICIYGCLSRRVSFARSE